MSVNRTPRQFWQEEPLRGEMLPNIRYEMGLLSRKAFNRDWPDAALVIALQKQQQAIVKRLAALEDVQRSWIFVAPITDHVVGLSYVTADNRRANVFCNVENVDQLLFELQRLDKREVIYCD